MAVVITCGKVITRPLKTTRFRQVLKSEKYLAVCLFRFDTRHVRMGEGGIAVGQSSKL